MSVNRTSSVARISNQESKSNAFDPFLRYWWCDVYYVCPTPITTWWLGWSISQRYIGYINHLIRWRHVSSRCGIVNGGLLRGIEYKTKNRRMNKFRWGGWKRGCHVHWLTTAPFVGSSLWYFGMTVLYINLQWVGSKEVNQWYMRCIFDAMRNIFVKNKWLGA